MNWKSRVVGAIMVLVVVLTSATAMADVGQAGEAVYAANFRVTWRMSSASYAWKFTLDARASQRAYEEMGDDGAIAGSFGTITMGMLGPAAQASALAGALWGLGSVALKRCSNSGQNGVVVYGWAYSAPDFDSDFESAMANDFRPAPWTDRLIPLWCESE